jgi:hypothetical protein
VSAAPPAGRQPAGSWRLAERLSPPDPRALRVHEGCARRAPDTGARPRLDLRAGEPSLGTRPPASWCSRQLARRGRDRRGRRGPTTTAPETDVVVRLARSGFALRDRHASLDARVTVAAVGTARQAPGNRGRRSAQTLSERGSAPSRARGIRPVAGPTGCPRRVIATRQTAAEIVPTHRSSRPIRGAAVAHAATEAPPGVRLAIRPAGELRVPTAVEARPQVADAAGDTGLIRSRDPWAERRDDQQNQESNTVHLFDLLGGQWLTETYAQPAKRASSFA